MSNDIDTQDIRQNPDAIDKLHRMAVDLVINMVLNGFMQMTSIVRLDSVPTGIVEVKIRPINPDQIEE